MQGIVYLLYNIILNRYIPTQYLPIRGLEISPALETLSSRLRCLDERLIYLILVDQRILYYR